MRDIAILIILIGLGLSSNGQSDKVRYVGINLFPIIGKTIELGYSVDIKPNLSTDFYTGYVFNSGLGSPYMIGTQYDLDNKSGIFIKIGTRYNLRNDIDKFAPFIGINIVNSIAIEAGTYDSDFNYNTPNEKVKKKSYNLGLNGIIGITSPITKKLNMDIGLQIGKVLIKNLIDFHSYMPGMGVNFPDGVRSQLMLRIKYRIK